MIEFSLLEIKKLIQEGKTTSYELTKEYINQIEKYKNYNAVIEVFSDAIDNAKLMDIKIKNGFTGRLAGVPIIIKDNILYDGHKVSCASKMLENYIAQYSSTVVEKLLEQGAVIIGRANMDEFAMGSGTESSYFGVCHNPLDFERVPGGSSGGSACAVKLNMCPIALGTDTGGSVRQPASFCGLVGIKPTYGRISRYGIVAYASSFDQVGIISKTVEDSAYLLEVLAGIDNHDMTSEDKTIDFAKDLGKSIEGIKVGVIKQVLELCKNTSSGKILLSTIEDLKQAGAQIEEIKINNLDLVLPTYYILATAEASANLDRYDGIKYTYKDETSKNLEEIYKKSRSQGFGTEVQRRIMLGTFVLSSGYYEAYYKKAKAVQNRLKREFKKAFKECDAIIMPTTIGEAYKIGEKSNPLEAYAEDVYTVTANITGLPSISVPAGIGENGLPIGMQFLANMWNEKTLYKIASFVEGR